MWISRGFKSISTDFNRLYTWNSMSKLFKSESGLLIFHLKWALHLQKLVTHHEVQLTRAATVHTSVTDTCQLYPSDIHQNGKVLPIISDYTCQNPKMTSKLQGSNLLHISLHQSNWYFQMLNYPRSIQHVQHTFAENLENPVESFGKTYSHQDPRRIWQISSVHCWSSTPARLRCGGSLIICWCEGKPRRFQREWKIFSGWSVGYKSAEVTWNHHEHGRIISGSCIWKK